MTSLYCDPANCRFLMICVTGVDGCRAIQELLPQIGDRLKYIEEDLHVGQVPFVSGRNPVK